MKKSTMILIIAFLLFIVFEICIVLHFTDLINKEAENVISENSNTVNVIPFCSDSCSCINE